MPFLSKDVNWTKIAPYKHKLNEAVVYKAKDGKIWRAPAGFITDGASIPRFAWSIIGSPFTGRYTKAAIIHDRFYDQLNVKRNYADRIFLEGMRELKVSWWRRRAMWGAVRAYSWTIWNRRKKLKR